jgi:hypothetical protein
MNFLRLALVLLALPSPTPPASSSEVIEVVAWKPAGISSPLFESHAAFDPITGDLYFVRSSPKFEGWRILVSRCGPAGWGRTEPPPFAGDGVEADPFFSPDGMTLYFISTRSTDGIGRADLDIWKVERRAKGSWRTPVRLPAPINSTGQEWFPRPAPDGWLYFGSNRPGGHGRTDIWRARAGPDGTWSVENLGGAINTAGDEYEAMVSPDGLRLILMAGDGLYESRRTANGWGPRAKLPPAVNVNGSEVGALWSPTGRSLLFSRDTGNPDSGEFFLLSWGPREPWPPSCPR